MIIAPFISLLLAAAIYNITLEEVAIARFFPDAPVMRDVAFCESRLRHFDFWGNVIQSSTGDYGLFQINARYHERMARRMGLNIYELTGNVQFARWLFDKQGLQPWEASRWCWEKKFLASK